MKKLLTDLHAAYGGHGGTLLAGCGGSSSNTTTTESVADKGTASQRQPHRGKQDLIPRRRWSW